MDISHSVGTSNNIGNSTNTNTNITAGNTTATNFDREGYTIPKMKRRTDERMSRAFNMQANKPAANGAAPGISADAGASRVTTSATNDIHEPDATTIVSMSDYTTMSRTYSTTGSASSSKLTDTSPTGINGFEFTEDVRSRSTRSGQQELRMSKKDLFTNSNAW